MVKFNTNFIINVDFQHAVEIGTDIEIVDKHLLFSDLESRLFVMLVLVSMNGFQRYFYLF